MRLIRRRRSPKYWSVQKLSFPFGWDSVDGSSSFDEAMRMARDLLDGKHPEDIIEIVAVRGDA